jgi:hypothetical protein
MFWSVVFGFFLFDFTFGCEPYSLSSFECSSFVNYPVFQNEVEQQEIYEQMKWQVSDIRLILPPCRPAILRCMCSIVFPMCRPNDNTSEIIYVCEDNCNSAIIEKCGGLINETMLQFLLPPGKIESDPTKECFSSQSFDHIPTTTCLPEGIKCCTGILNINEYGDCDSYCTSFIDRSSERTLEIIMLVIAWCSFGTMIIGCIPFVLDEYARTFPNHIPLFLIVSSTFLSLTITWGSYSGAFQTGSYTCDHTSNLCQIQIFLGLFLIFMSLMYSVWLCYRITFACYSHIERVKNIFPHLSSKPFHILWVHGTSIGIPLLLSFSQLIIIKTSSDFSPISTSPGGFCFLDVNPKFAQFYVFFIPLSLIAIVLGVQIVLISFRFARAPWVFLVMQLRATFTAFYMFVYAITLIVLAIIVIEAYLETGAYENHFIPAYLCVVVQPENPNPHCPDSLQVVNVGFVYFVGVILSGTSFVVSSFICLSHFECWEWWMDLVLCKPVVSMSFRLNPTLSQVSSRTTTRKLQRVTKSS